MINLIQGFYNEYILLLLLTHINSASFNLQIIKCFPSKKEYLPQAFLLHFYRLIADENIVLLTPSCFIPDGNTVLPYLIYIFTLHVFLNSSFAFDNLYCLYIMCTMK